MTTAGDVFAAVFIGGAAIAGVVFFIDAADNYDPDTEGRIQMNLRGPLSWALALAMGAWKF